MFQESCGGKAGHLLLSHRLRMFCTIPQTAQRVGTIESLWHDNSRLRGGNLEKSKVGMVYGV